MEFDPTNRGVLFKNDRKQEGDKKPEYTGSLNVDGVEFFLDAWLKTGKTGAKFMSVSVKRKDVQPQAQPAQRPAQSRDEKNPTYAQAKTAPGGSRFDDFDSDIPF